MARFNKLQTLNYINENKIVPVFYNSDIDISINVIEQFGYWRMVPLSN